MRKLISALFALIIIVGCGDAGSKNNDAINNEEIYFFYTTRCPYCHYALDFINKNYPEVELRMENVESKPSYDLFMKCAQKFDLPRNMLGTPLICIGDNYVLGWSDQSAESFGKYLQEMEK